MFNSLTSHIAEEVCDSILTHQQWEESPGGFWENIFLLEELSLISLSPLPHTHFLPLETVV